MRGINICINSILNNIELDNWQEVEVLMNILHKHIYRKFKGIMPHRYLIFPTTIDIYLMSKSVCIEVPSWGGSDYRKTLVKLGSNLEKLFIMDTQYYDGKTTFLIRDLK